MPDTDKTYIQPDLSLFGEEHVKRYLETGGETGHIWNGVTTLLLTTTGRKSGEARVQPMIYCEDDGRFVVIASRGGAPMHPGWYHNLHANPNVQVQVKEKKFDATASTAEGAERERLWKLMTDIWPNFDQYQERTERVIPVVVLTPADTL